MATAEELLAAVYLHEHAVTDSDSYFLIDPVTRKLENTARKKNVIMQHDHDSECFTFELPRYVEGHDMTLCNSILVHWNNIDGETGEETAESTDITDLRVNPDNEETVICSWLISRNSTQRVGTLNFLVQYKCVDEEGVATYEWHTDIYDSIEIRKSRNNGPQSVIEYTDILEQWRARLFGAGESVITDINTTAETQLSAIESKGAVQLTAITNEAATQKANIEAKGAATLATIPAEYTELYNLANSAERTKSDAITREAEGSMITITDSSNDYIRDLKVYGKTTQVTTKGKNLFDKNLDNITLLDKTESPHYGYELNLPAGTYTVSCANSYNAYIYASVYNGVTVGETVYVVLPTELRTGTFTLNDGDTLYIYNAVNVNYGLGGESTTKSIFNACQIQVEAGDKATSYEPYSNGIPSPSPEFPQEIMFVDNPIVHVSGKNILNNRAIDKTANGITFTVNTDKSVTINGTSTSSVFLDLDTTSPIGLAGTELIASLGGNGDVVMNVGYFTVDGYVNDCIVGVTADEQTFVYPADAKKMRVYIYAGTGSTFDNVTVYPMIRLAANVDNTYEPYTGSSITLTSTLHGIPVSEGGNYTDSDGQQWICDEVDLVRGVYVQRIYKHTLTGTEYWAKTNVNDLFQASTPLPVKSSWVAGYCTHYGVKTTYNGSGKPYFRMTEGGTLLYYEDVIEKYTTLDEWKTFLANQVANQSPVEIVYVLATPIETPLSEAEIVAFKYARTNYPNTTILNDKGAYMSAKYNADTLIFLRDNQPKPAYEQIAAAIRDYLDANGIRIPSEARIGEVSLPASAWVGSNYLYSQVVSIDGATKYSQVDLTPSIEQLAIFYEKDVAFVTENDDGVVTVYAIGQKPTSDYVIQVTMTEVVV
jgi:hypothetical protein